LYWTFRGKALNSGGLEPNGRPVPVGCEGKTTEIEGNGAGDFVAVTLTKFNTSTLNSSPHWFDLTISFLPDYPTAFQNTRVFKARFTEDLRSLNTRFVVGTSTVSNNLPVTRNIL
jgi:hypothetical protein